SAERDRQLGESVWTTAGILRQPLSFRAERPQVNFFARGIVGVRVEMKNRHAGEKIRSQLVFAEIEQVVFGEQIPLGYVRLEVQIARPEIGLAAIAVRRGDPAIGQV